MKMSKFIKPILLVLAIMIVICSGALYWAHGHAAILLNKQLAKQKILKGNITIKNVYPDLKGNIYFDDIQWSDEDHVHLKAAKGRIKVKLWNIATFRPDINAIDEIELIEPVLNFQFDDNMRISALSVDHKATEGEHIPEESEEFEVNIDFSNKYPDVKLILNKGSIGAFYKQRDFLFKDVHLEAAIKNGRYLGLNLNVGEFGGDIVGKTMNLSGKVDLLKNQENVSLSLGMYGVVPESMGLGNIKNPLDISGTVSGQLKSPVIKGTIEMKQLDIPPMVFHKVSGEYHYESGIVSLYDVVAKIWDGDVKASGLYHFDHNNYRIDIHGEKLMISSATKNVMYKGRCNLDMYILSSGKSKETIYAGSFQTGRGSVMFLPFKSLSGEFSSKTGETDFHNVVLDTDLGTLYMDDMEIHKNRVVLGEIYTYENGEKKIIRK
ncbi:MAG: hypothetical protein Q4D21_03725 [Phascolarctobacterium sp.]|nr:hypothetical protein [Phascolarctobacterium sp.]